jgi:hypothetical protein
MQPHEALEITKVAPKNTSNGCRKWKSVHYIEECTAELVV